MANMANLTTQAGCQITSLAETGEGLAPGPRQSLVRRLKLMIRRRLSPHDERKLKASSDSLINRVRRTMGREMRPAVPLPGPSPTPLQSGDLVRVRSRQEIEATLNNWHQLRGCTFMPEMAEYCDTRQRVRKRLERFVDERDLRAKRCRGVILLEGVTCQGTAEFGRCDRSCYLFWREEWLERVS